MYIYAYSYTSNAGLVYILTPVFHTPNNAMMNPCGRLSIVMEEPSFLSMRLRVQYRLPLLSLKFKITNHMRQDEEDPG